MSLTGGCHCGAIRYEVSGDPFTHAICHCTDCRRHSGAPMVSWTMYPVGSLRVTRGTPKVYVSSEHARRHFCADCGTGLFYYNDSMLPDTGRRAERNLRRPGRRARACPHPGGRAHSLDGELPMFDRFPRWATARMFDRRSRGRWHAVRRGLEIQGHPGRVERRPGVWLHPARRARPARLLPRQRVPRSVSATHSGYAVDVSPRSRRPGAPACRGGSLVLAGDRASRAACVVGAPPSAARPGRLGRVRAVAGRPCGRRAPESVGACVVRAGKRRGVPRLLARQGRCAA
jgi:hypothetical protein